MHINEIEEIIEIERLVHCTLIAERDVESRELNIKMTKFTFLTKVGFSFHTFLKICHYVQLPEAKQRNSELSIGLFPCSVSYIPCS